MQRTSTVGFHLATATTPSKSPPPTPSFSNAKFSFNALVCNMIEAFHNAAKIGVHPGDDLLANEADLERETASEKEGPKARRKPPKPQNLPPLMQE